MLITPRQRRKTNTVCCESHCFASEHSNGRVASPHKMDTQDNRQHVIVAKRVRVAKLPSRDSERLVNLQGSVTSRGLSPASEAQETDE